MTQTNRRSRAVLPRILSFSKLIPVLLVTALVTAFAIASSCQAADGDSTGSDFVIYTYDSMVADGGLGPAIFPEFERLCHCRVRAVAAGDSSQILNRLQIDAKRGVAGAQVVLGLDEPLWAKARPLLEDWGHWAPKGIEKTKTLREPNGFLPYDYGVFAFMSDTAALGEAKLKPPDGLQDLLKPEWRRKVLLEDPRTSGPGLAFLLYAVTALGAKAKPFLHDLSRQWLTLAPGWDGAYELFMKKEAPLVWSYTTSQAYHEEHPEQRGRYRALLFREGQPYQVEGAAWVKGGLRNDQDRARAKLFLEFLLSPAVQEKIPLRNWMFPSVLGTKLPESFLKLPEAMKRVSLPTKPAEIDRVLRDWDLSVH